MSENECSICLEDIHKNEEKILMCNHKFHKKCINKWTKINNICPLCRKIINNTFFVKIKKSLCFYSKFNFTIGNTNIILKKNKCDKFPIIIGFNDITKIIRSKKNFIINFIKQNKNKDFVNTEINIYFKNRTQIVNAFELMRDNIHAANNFIMNVNFYRNRLFNNNNRNLTNNTFRQQFTYNDYLRLTNQVRTLYRQ